MTGVRLIHCLNKIYLKRCAIHTREQKYFIKYKITPIPGLSALCMAIHLTSFIRVLVDVSHSFTESIKSSPGML